MDVTVLVPVKDPGQAKSRLTPPPGVNRAELVRAMALDVIAAVREAGYVAAVVTDDAALAAAAAELGAHHLPDRPGGLNAALAAAAADISSPVAALAADLPCLNGPALREAIDSALQSGSARAYCPDAPGSGTALLVARTGSQLHPEFGLDSAARHERSGAMRLAGSAGLRRDVDTAEDLTAAIAVGVGPRTAAALAGGAPTSL